MKVIFYFLLIFIISYPLIICNLPVIQTTFSSSFRDGMSDLNIKVQDSVSYSVTHKYFFLELPVYVNGIEIRLLNKVWCSAIVLEIFLFIYLVIRYFYGKKYNYM